MTFTLTPEDIQSWPQPNYINPKSQGRANTIVVSLLGPLALIVMAGRMYTRSRIIRNVGIDDWLMLLATATAIPLGIILCYSNTYGWGRHIWDLKKEWYVPVRRISWIGQILFLWSSAFTKLSILAFYLRVMSAMNTIAVLGWIGIFIVAGAALSFCMAVIFYCVPVAAYWDQSITDPKCINQGAALIANAAVSVFTDFYVFIIPIGSVLRLRLPRRQKAWLIITLALGFTSCITGVCRILYIIRLETTKDWSWEGAMVFAFTAAEAYLGIICASIPALKPLFTRYFPNFLGSTEHIKNPSLSIRDPPVGRRGGREGGFVLRSIDPRFDATATIEANQPGKRGTKSRRSSTLGSSAKSGRRRKSEVKGAASSANHGSEECIVDRSNMDCIYRPAGIGKEVRVEVTVEKLEGSPHVIGMDYGLPEGSPEAEAYQFDRKNMDAHQPKSRTLMTTL